MNVTLLEDQQRLLYEVPSEFDALAVRECRQFIEEQIEAEQSIHIFDFSRTNFLDSSGIGAVVFLYKRLKARGKKMYIIGLTGQPEEIVKLLKVDSVIKTFKDIESVKTP